MNSINLNINWRHAFLTAVGFIVLMQSGESFAARSFVCNHPDKRPGGYGALDLGCDADQFGDVSRIKLVYPMLVLDRRSNDADYYKEYITNVNATVKAVARAYYLQRVPDAKAATLAAWEKAAVAVAAHESKLSHYRISDDGRYKLMTGDHLVSHGIMQVNQNFNANAILDSSFDFVGNVVGGLDTYFVEWNRAIKQDCYMKSLGKNPSLELMLENRARSAYSAYNGGPGRLCRFADTKSHYRSHDAAFFDTLHNRPWAKWVKDEKRAAPVNVKCLIEGNTLCAMAKPARIEFIKSRPLLLGDGRTCVTENGTDLVCSKDARIFSCLAHLDPDILENDPMKLDAVPQGSNVTNISDRDELCNRRVKGLIKVGSQVVLRKEILMRETIGGSPIGNAKTNRVYSVTDYDLRLDGKTERYYHLVTPNGSEGWVYGGSDSDLNEWIQAATPTDLANIQQIAETAKAAKLEKQAAETNDIVVTAPRKKLPVVAATPATPATAATPSPAVTAKPVPTPPPAASNSPKAVAAIPVAKADADDESSDIQPVLPAKGSIVEIVRADGIPMREVAGEDVDKPYKFQLFKDAHLTVEEVKILGEDNKIFLKVTSGANTGWIYAGHTLPTVTVSSWIKIWK